MSRNTKVSLRYAKALFEFSEIEKSQVQVNEDMLLISKTMEDSSDLQAFLNDPTQKNSLKFQVLQAVYQDKTSKITSNFIQMLINNKRINVLREIAGSYNLLFDKSIGRETAYVTTTMPINDAIKAIALKKATEISGKKEVKLVNILNPSMIGGFILRIGDVEYNDGLSSKLTSLKRIFDNSIFESKS